MLVVKSAVWEFALENEHGAIFSIYQDSLLQSISKNIEQDKSFLDCKVFIGYDKNHPGVEILDVNRLLVESLAKHLRGKLFKYPGNPPINYFDARGMEPHLIRGVLGLIHGKVTGVAMLELANFFNALKWLGVELSRFSYTPGPLKTRITSSSGNVMRIYNDVMDMCQFYVDPELWKFNWLNNRRMGYPYNYTQKLD